MNQSRKVVKDVEVYFLYDEKGPMAKLTIFDSSMDYLVFATSHCPPHYGVTSKAVHTNKSKCARMAIKQMYQLIKE